MSKGRQWRFQRASVSIRATLMPYHSAQVRSATVTEISLTGALLVLDAGDPLANNFEMKTADGEVVRCCEIVWRQGLKVAVKFESQRPPT